MVLSIAHVFPTLVLLALILCLTLLIFLMLELNWLWRAWWKMAKFGNCVKSLLEAVCFWMRESYNKRHDLVQDYYYLP